MRVRIHTAVLRLRNSWAGNIGFTPPLFSGPSLKMNMIELQSNQVKRTPPDYIDEFIILILNPLVFSSRIQKYIDYLNIEPDRKISKWSHRNEKN